MDSLQGQLNNGLAEVIFHWVVHVVWVKLLKKAFRKSKRREEKSDWGDILQKLGYGQSTGTVKHGVRGVIFHWVIWVTAVR